MSAVLKKAVNKASSELKAPYKEHTIKEIDPNEKKIHYVFWAGLKPIPCQEQNIGIALVKPFKITPVRNWGCWTRDQDDKGSSGLRRHPGKNRGNEVWDTRGKEAGQNAEWLERCYGGKGLVVIRDLTGLEPDFVATIVDNLIPAIPDDVTYESFISMVRANVSNNPPKDAVKLQEKVAKQIIEACEIAQGAGLNELAAKKAEIGERSVAGGKGIPRLDQRAYDLIKLVGKTTADYETDTKAAGDAAAQQVAKVVGAIIPAMQQQQPQASALLTPEQMQQQATILALAMQQMGFAPVQAQGQPQPITPVATPAKPEPAKTK